MNQSRTVCWKKWQNTSRAAMWSQYSSWFGATPHIPLWFKAAALVIKWSTLAFVSNTRNHSNFHPCLKSVFGPFLLISITPCMSCKTLIINVAFKNFVFSSFPNFLSLPYLHFSRIHLPELLWFFWCYLLFICAFL